MNEEANYTNIDMEFITSESGLASTADYISLFDAELKKLQLRGAGNDVHAMVSNLFTCSVATIAALEARILRLESQLGMIESE